MIVMENQRLCRMLLLTWLAGAGGCTGLVRKQSQGEVLALSVNAHVFPATGEAAARPSRPFGQGSVHIGERVELLLTPTKAAYVYAINYFGDAASVRLFPRAEPKRVAAGQTVRVPEESNQFLQDGGVAATMRLYVVASEAPLGPEQCLILRLDCESKAQEPAEQGRGEDKGEDKRSQPATERSSKPKERTPDEGRDPSRSPWRDPGPLRPGIGGSAVFLPVILRFE